MIGDLDYRLNFSAFQTPGIGLLEFNNYLSALDPAQLAAVVVAPAVHSAAAGTTSPPTTPILWPSGITQIKYLVEQVDVIMSADTVTIFVETRE